MALDTDLSRKPYFDDYDVTKNFYRVLYRPAAAVQARELNQMQTIMQDQIDKFGRHIFKEGSVIEGCAFTFDNSYNYVKIKDNYANNSAISNISDFIGKTVINTNGLQARVINSVNGYESDNINLNSLYLKYLNSSTYANGLQQSTFSNGEVIQIRTSANVNIGNVVVATVTNSTGKGYAFTTTEGVIFKKGFFIRVEPQTLIVSKYDNIPDGISVGFEADEQIITPEIDTSLLDNAAGSPNYDAPGAHRLKLVPTLVTRASNSISNTSTFFSLCDFKNGLPISVKNDPQYAALAKDTARRTYETNGDYVVNPFLLSTSNKITNSIANSSYNSIVASPGIGYVKGYRVEFVNNNTADLRKGLDYVTVNNQIVTATFGYYFNVNEFCGDFNNKNAVQVDLHSETKKAISNNSFLTTSYSSTTKIGTAYVRGVSYSSGTPGIPDAVYEIYVFNIQMSAGQKLSDIRSIIYYNGSLKAVADIILDKDFSNVSITKVQASNAELMIYPFGQNAIRPEGFSTTAQYIYRNRVNSSFSASGSLSLTLPSVFGQGSELFNYGVGVLSQSAKNSFIVIPTANGYSPNKSGTVSVNATSVNVVGSSTTFLSQYQVDDYFFCNTAIKRIVSITNNTSMAVDSVFNFASSGLTHQKTWPAGVPINFSSPSRTINITSSRTATISLEETSNTDFGAAVYFDTLRANTIPIAKELKNSTYIRIEANTHPAGAAGPWCLGIPDVFRLNAVYIDESGSNTYSSNNTNITGSFRLNNGQQDSYYGLAYISTRKPIAPNSTLLISVDNFVTANGGGGVGFFTAASYPIDDVNISDTTKIRTHQIPQYTSTIGTTIDLRNSIDFRPYVVNTAIHSGSTANTGTINPSNTFVLRTYGSGDSNGVYLVAPDSNYQSVVQYYLPRKDRIALTTSGEMLVTEGESSLAPVPPNEIPGTMTIGFATIPPYPSLTPTESKISNRYDYSVQTTLFQTKRYTMADINKLSKRIERLEYYTSLSLLEQATNSLTVRSDATGQNRFKNGILVDPFKDHSIGNTNDGTYNIAIDRNTAEARPLFNQMTSGLEFDSSKSTAQKAGDLILLPHTSNNLNQSQIFASKYRNCIEGNIYNYRGTLKLTPPGITTADLLQKPLINGSIDNYTNFVKGGSSNLNTEWGNWTDAGSPSITGQDTQTNLTAASQTSQTFRTTTTTTLAQQQSRTGKKFTTQPTESTVDVGDYVTDVSIQTYIPSTDVYFTAKGMKPNTNLYVYFDNINVSVYCLNLTPYVGSWTKSGGNYIATNGSYVYIAHDGTVYSHSNYWGAQITSDSYGNVYGIFKIPPNIFKSGQLEFKLTDIAYLEQGESAVSTQATYSMFCSPLSIQKQKSLLTIRSPQIVTEEVTESQVIYKNTSDYTEWVKDLPPIVKPPVTPTFPERETPISPPPVSPPPVVQPPITPTPTPVTPTQPVNPQPETQPPITPTPVTVVDVPVACYPILPPPQDHVPWLPPFAFIQDPAGEYLIPLQHTDFGFDLYIPLPPPPSPVVPADDICALPLTPAGQPDPVQPPTVAIEPAAPVITGWTEHWSGDGTCWPEPIYDNSSPGLSQYGGEGGEGGWYSSDYYWDPGSPGN
jgi:hypothetical protein